MNEILIVPPVLSVNGDKKIENMLKLICISYWLFTPVLSVKGDEQYDWDKEISESGAIYDIRNI